MNTLFKLPKKQKEVIPPKAQAKPTSTYIRKYYLIRKAKADGFQLTKQNDLRIFWITSDKVQDVKQNKYLQELAKKHGYGIHIKNPL